MALDKTRPSKYSDSGSETPFLLSLMGWMCWLFAALVIYFRGPNSQFHPREAVLILATTLAALGLVLQIAGRVLRSRSHKQSAAKSARTGL